MGKYHIKVHGRCGRDESRNGIPDRDGSSMQVLNRIKRWYHTRIGDS